MLNYTEAKKDIFEKAGRYGAVKCRIYCTKTLLYHGRKVWKPFCYYFFDKMDYEIGNFHPDLIQFSGLTLWDEPRKWDESFKTGEDIYECTLDEALNPQINKNLL